MNIQVKGNSLVIEVDVSPATLKSAPPSASGKSRLVASTRGSTQVSLPGGGSVSVGLNVFIK